MNEWKLVASLVLSFLIVVEINRKKYSPFLAVGMVLIAWVFPIVALPLYLFIRFTNVSFSSLKNPRHTPLEASQKMCPKCGHENASAASSCSECGNQLRLS
jgi:hypothetical protein